MWASRTSCGVKSFRQCIGSAANVLATLFVVSRVRSLAVAHSRRTAGHRGCDLEAGVDPHESLPLLLVSDAKLRESSDNADAGLHLSAGSLRARDCLGGFAQGHRPVNSLWSNRYITFALSTTQKVPARASATALSIMMASPGRPCRAASRGRVQQAPGPRSGGSGAHRREGWRRRARGA